MALTAINTSKQSVTKVQEKLFNILVHLKVFDATVLVIDEDFSVRYRTGDNISLKKDKLYQDMVLRIQQYLDEQVIFTAAQLTTVVASIETDLKTKFGVV